MKFMFATAVGALIAAAPAAAQTYSSGHYPGGYYQQPTQYQYPVNQYGQAYAPPNAQQPYHGSTAAERIDSRIDMLQTRLNAGVRSGAISWKESQPLHQRMHQLSRLERQYSSGGLDARERADLRERIRALRQEIRVADNGSYDRYERVDQYGYYYEPTPYGSAYGQGGPYEPIETAPPAAPSGPGGVLGTIVNSIFGTSGLQVGQPVTSGLYAVPYQYQSQFRDGNGVYYRSDGQRIYQIDARTNRVSNVYSINR